MNAQTGLYCWIHISGLTVGHRVTSSTSSSIGKQAETDRLASKINMYRSNDFFMINRQDIDIKIELYRMNMQTSKNMWLWLFLVLALSITDISMAKVSKGLMIYGHEVHTFQPCDDTSIFWITASTSIHQQLQAESRELIKQPYEAVYVKIDGEITSQKLAGFAKAYDGTIIISNVHKLSRVDVNSCPAVRKPVFKNLSEKGAKTYVFDCDNQSSYIVRTNKINAWLFHLDGTEQLSVIQSDIGEQYSGEGFKLWINDQQTQIIEPSGKQLACDNNRKQAIWEHAKLNGADFRAIGNEPGWNLVMDSSRIILMSSYGAYRTEVKAPSPIVSNKTRTTRWETAELTLEISENYCRDTMSGEVFDFKVLVRTEKEVLQGCGRELR